MSLSISSLQHGDRFWYGGKVRTVLDLPSETRPAPMPEVNNKPIVIKRPAVRECPADRGMIHVHTDKGDWCLSRSISVAEAE